MSTNARWKQIFEEDELQEGSFIRYKDQRLKGERNKSKFDSLDDVPDFMVEKGLVPYPTVRGMTMVPLEKAFITLPECDRELHLDAPDTDRFWDLIDGVSHGDSEDVRLNLLEEAGLWSALLDIRLTLQPKKQFKGSALEHSVGTVALRTPVSNLRPDLVFSSHKNNVLLAGEVKRAANHNGKTVAVRQLVPGAMYLHELRAKEGRDTAACPVFIHGSDSLFDAKVFVFSPVKPGQDAAAVTVTHAVHVTIG